MLRIYQPAEDSVSEDDDIEAAETAEVSDADAAVLLSFADWVAGPVRSSTSECVDRTRTLAGNLRCPECRRSFVIPLTLNDARLDKAGHVVPGTQSLVGFHCRQCRHEWPA